MIPFDRVPGPGAGTDDMVVDTRQVPLQAAPIEVVTVIPTGSVSPSR